MAGVLGMDQYRAHDPWSHSHGLMVVVIITMYIVIQSVVIVMNQNIFISV